MLCCALDFFPENAIGDGPTLKIHISWSQPRLLELRCHFYTIKQGVITVIFQYIKPEISIFQLNTTLGCKRMKFRDFFKNRKNPPKVKFSKML